MLEKKEDLEIEIVSPYVKEITVNSDVRSVIVRQAKANGRVTPAQLREIINLRIRGLSADKIGKIVGRSPKTIESYLRKNKRILAAVKDREKAEEFRKDVLSKTETTLLQSLSDREAIKKATLNQRAYAFKELHNARRLEEGKSTSNQAISHTFQALDLGKFKK